MSKRPSPFKLPPDLSMNYVIALCTIEGSIVATVVLLLPVPSSILVGLSAIIIIPILLLLFFTRIFVRKYLNFEFFDLQSLMEDVNISPFFSENLKITYKTIEVQRNQLHRMMLKIRNEGNTWIDKKDFNEKPVVINFSDKIKLLDVIVKEKSLPTIIANAYESPHTESQVTIEPFSLPVHEWFKVRLTLDCVDQNLSNVLKDIDIPSEGSGDESSFAFDILKSEKWKEKIEKRVKRRNTMLFFTLLTLGILALILWIFVWFIPDNSSFLTLQYQFLLAVVLAILYVGLLFSMVFNRIAPTTSS